jgi:hypothetical protein
MGLFDPFEFKTLFQQSRREIILAGLVMVCIGIAFCLDAAGSPNRQMFLAVCAWTILFTLLLWEETPVRLQVAVAVAFATVGEHFASPFMQAYIYRFDNVPPFVPPGHGMVYLSAVALARTPFMQHYGRWITGIALVTGTLWSIWGNTLAVRPDAEGALLFSVFFLFVLFGRSPLVYVSAFFITSYLEIVGTWLGVWHWVPNEPVFGLSQANPPSGIAAWYCLVDAVALAGAPLLLRGLEWMRGLELPWPTDWLPRPVVVEAKLPSEQAPRNYTDYPPRAETEEGIDSWLEQPSD